MANFWRCIKLLILAAILGATFAPQYAEAQMDCGDFWGERGVTMFPRSGGAFACYEYDPISDALIVGPGTQYRIFYTAAWDDSPPLDAAELLETIAEGFDRSVRHFQGLGLAVHETYILVSNETAVEAGSGPFYTDDDLTEGEVSLPGDWAFGPCPIAVYDSAITNATEQGEDVIKQLLAHEVFHCVQWFNFAENIPDRKNGWLAEGTAEYFSAEVYPCVNNEHSSAIAYDADRPFTRQDYPAAAVLHHFARASGFGQEGILAIIRAQSGGGKNQQERELAQFGAVRDAFHAFAKDYVDNDSPDCGGAMPLESNKGPMTTFGEGGGQIRISSELFAIDRHQVRLEKGKKYFIRRENEEGEGDISWRENDKPDGWTDIPEDIEVKCDEAETRYIVASNAAEDRADYKLTLRFEEDTSVPQKKCCELTGEYDRCLIGDWIGEPAGLEAWLQSVFARMNPGGPPTTLDSFDADIRFQLLDFATAQGTITNAQARATMRQLTPRGDVREQPVLIEGGGPSTAYWSNREGNILSICPTDNRVKFNMIVENENGRIVVPFGPPLDAEENDERFDFEYTCSGNALTLRRSIRGLPDQVYRATRAPSE